MKPRHISHYSPRARLGLIVPPTNTVNEAEWSRMMPEGVTFHTHRMALHLAGDEIKLMNDLTQAVGMLSQCGADVIAYACTAGSMTVPAQRLPEQITKVTGKQCLTTSAALIDALTVLGVKRLSVATPYAQITNDHEEAFLAAHGFEVLSIAGLGIGENGPQEFIRIAQTPLDRVLAHALETFDPASDALIIACTDFPTLPLIADLEQKLGVPVITSNQATFWAMLRAAGINDRIDGLGQLLNAH